MKKGSYTHQILIVVKNSDGVIVDVVRPTEPMFSNDPAQRIARHRAATANWHKTNGTGHGWNISKEGFTDATCIAITDALITGLEVDFIAFELPKVTAQSQAADPV